MRDLTPLGHAAAAVFAQVITGLFFNMWLAGGMIGCVWFLAREHTQAEYRWIEKYGSGKRVNMPWWGGVDYRVWDISSLLDCIVPVIACSAILFVYKSVNIE
ncbi:hypothetical protein [Enterobacter roggenkampii]|uniref:hypothetical protein n=1 Tax=Enterobacter roggenkampii TaxID=1812935 RepID=UPI000930F55B|nr:hypothetical protein [Enterobacter roggenkampii]